MSYYKGEAQQWLRVKEDRQNAVSDGLHAEMALVQAALYVGEQVEKVNDNLERAITQLQDVNAKTERVASEVRAAGSG